MFKRHNKTQVLLLIILSLVAIYLAGCGSSKSHNALFFSQINSTVQYLNLDKVPSELLMYIRQQQKNSTWMNGCSEENNTPYYSYNNVLFISINDYMCDHSNSYITATHNQLNITNWSIVQEGKPNVYIQAGNGNHFYLVIGV